MFKRKVMLFGIVLCMVLVVSVGFAAWTITDTFIGSTNGTIDADMARSEDFVEISDPTEFLRYTNDGFMYYYENNSDGEKVQKYYNQITVNVTVDVNKWKELFGDTVDSIYVELTLDCISNLSDNYSIISSVSSYTLDSNGTKSESDDNITGYKIDLTNLNKTIIDEVEIYDDVEFSATFVFSGLSSEAFSNVDSILRYEGNMFNINSTISVNKN